MIVFATNNPHKLSEVRQIVGDRIKVCSLADINCHEDIPETATTIRGNAEMKARYISEHYGVDCFADDTGLEVDALGGEPGVYSARYAGPACDSKANMAKLLGALGDNPDRQARFRTVIALSRNGEIRCVEGVVEGSITTAPSGSDGFGYDPIFMPDEAGGLTFAQMLPEAKNAISHRGRAISKLLEIL